VKGISLQFLSGVSGRLWAMLGLGLLLAGGEVRGDGVFFPSGAKEDGFGAAVVNTGRYVVVGAPLDDTRGTNAGAVYVFDAVTQRLLRKLYGYQASAGARFGSSVGLSGGVLVVGSPGKAGGQGEMSWHSFPAGAALGVFPGSIAGGGGFGSSIAISGTLVAVGAPNWVGAGQAGAGRVTVFDLRNPFWNGFYSAPVAEAGARFGATVACDGTVILVGAPGEDGPQGADQGAVYAFDFSLVGRTEPVAKMVASLGQAGDEFGASLAFGAGRAFIGAPQAADETGAIYPVTVNGFVLGAALPGAAVGDRFGAGLALNRSRLVVGVPGASVGDVAGAGAIWYYPDAEALVEPEVITAAEPQAGAGFGAGVSVGGEMLVAVAPSQNSLDLARGAAHWFSGFALDLALVEVYSKGQEATGASPALLQPAIQAQWDPAGVPIVLAPLLSPKGKGIWSFASRSPSRIRVIGDVLQDSTATFSDLREMWNNGSRYGMTRVVLRGTGVTAANRNAILFGDVAALRTGSTAAELNADTVRTIGAVGQSLAFGQAHLKLNPSRERGTSAANDSVLWMYRPAVGDWETRCVAIREGMTVTTGDVTEAIGEILPHAAITQEDEAAEPGFALVAALGTQAASNQAFFMNGVDAPVLRRGGVAPGGGTYLSFLGVNLQGDRYLVRATLRTGSGVTTRNNEGLWSNRGGSNELVLRKGVAATGLPTGVTVRRFYEYALLESGVVIARCQMTGRGIGGGNDMVLLMMAGDGQVRVLEAEGNGLSDSAGGRISVMQRLDVAGDGSYQLLASLGGAPASSNQALLQGMAAVGANRPLVVIRKNDLVFGLPDRIRSIGILPGTRPTGALGGGLPTTLMSSAEGPVSLVSLELVNRAAALYRLGAADGSNEGDDG